ncbi:hypothetical protein [Paenibacillus apiarius]|uniref:hypothetical protein n=1 Tax=Paenibacillus apiarius TaxID=46240 RepID=UPI00197F24A1|nr:hypothetical protein [Paenibacillus apiarius]MBN3524165.1 hypothetical protein [Paenibacillus apiarius]
MLFQMNCIQLRKANLSTGSGGAGGVRGLVPVQVKRIDSWNAGSFVALTPKETVHEIGRQDHAADCSILMELGEA